MAGKQPTHRVCLQPDSEEKFTIEVGAAWEHKGGVLTLILKRGLALTGAAGSRIVLFPIDHERDEKRKADRGRDDGDSRARGRGERDERREGSRTRGRAANGNGGGDDDIPF